MPSELSAFEKLDGIDDLFTAYKGNLRCTAIRLNDGRLCLYSPVQGIGQKALQSLAEIGEVAFLLAPNHYHHKGLKEYVKSFPNALLCAPDYAAPRLQKVTGLSFSSLETLEALFPAGIAIVTPDGLKTGEIWLRIENADKTAWLLVDAFCGPKIGKGNAEAEIPETLKTFPVYGTGDRASYRSWVSKQIGNDRPEILIPCHGAVVRAKDLPAKLERLVDEIF